MTMYMRFFSSVLIGLGVGIFVLGIGLLSIIFYPIVKEELGYDIRHAKETVPYFADIRANNPEITPVDKQFGIVIPKIGANSKVIPQVDPYNEAMYQQALTKGVAHAKGSALPYQKGNVFLFSHSSVNFYEAQKYNSIFYLLYKLEQGDSVDLYYGGSKYEYIVTGRKIVNPEAVNFLKADTEDTLTLMTCWPPGTSFQRLLIQAEKKKNLSQ